MYYYLITAPGYNNIFFTNLAIARKCKKSINAQSYEFIFLLLYYSSINTTKTIRGRHVFPKPQAKKKPGLKTVVNTSCFNRHLTAV